MVYQHIIKPIWLQVIFTSFLKMSKMLSCRYMLRVVKWKQSDIVWLLNGCFVLCCRCRRHNFFLLLSQLIVTSDKKNLSSTILLSIVLFNVKIDYCIDVVHVGLQSNQLAIFHPNNINNRLRQYMYLTLASKTKMIIYFNCFKIMFSDTINLRK